MAYFIRLEKKEDLEWLEKILANSVEKLRQRDVSYTLEAASEHIIRCYDAVLTAVPAKEKKALGVGDEFVETSQASSKKTQGSKDDYVPGLCATHPKNAIQRAPRTDCEGCWSAYKRLHPLEYEKSRRNFERRNK